jgi:hypothetical protein
VRPSGMALCFVLACVPSVVSAQTAKVTHNVNLRPDPSSEYAPLRLLKIIEPPPTLLQPVPEYGRSEGRS